MPKIEGSPFISKKRHTNGIKLNNTLDLTIGITNSKVDFKGKNAILKPNTREQRRQLDNILDN